ncbi:efflux RND transporter periplasmic adaptor subunit [Planctomycetota bacterium]|nr:efflux RND transporter periplasmic adaptor subunit [Planctomycetota bacterium]
MNIPKTRYLIPVGALAVATLFAMIRPPGAAAADGTRVEVKQDGNDSKNDGRGGGSGGGNDGGGFSFSFGGSDEGRQVDVFSARRGPIAAQVEAPGSVRAGSEVGFGAPFEGTVLELVHDEGDRVEADEVIFRLDPTEHSELLEEAQIDLERKQAALEQTAIELEEAQRLATDSDTEPSELTEARLRLRQTELEEERAETQVEAAKVSLDRSRQMLAQEIGREIDVETAEIEWRVSIFSRRIASESAILARETLTFRERTWVDSRANAVKNLSLASIAERQARVDLRLAELQVRRKTRDVERCDVLAPLTGIITGRAVNRGDHVARATGDTSHYIISDLDHLLVYADVDEGDVIKVERGQRVSAIVNALSSDSRLAGVVYDVGYRAQTATDAEVSTFLVRVLLDPDQEHLDTLRPGMSGSVDIEVNRNDDALKVPLQAIVQRERQDIPDEILDATDPALLEGKRSFDPLDMIFLVENGKTRVIVVKLGIHDSDEVELLTEIPADSTLVVGPFRALEDLGHDEKVRTEEAENVLGEDKDVFAPATDAATEDAPEPEADAADSESETE